MNEISPMWALSIAVGVISSLVTAMAWLIVRSVGEVDRHLHKQDGSLEALEKGTQAHGEAIVEIKVRLAHQEVETGLLRAKYDQIGGFLSRTMKFRRSDQDDEDGP